MKKYQFNKLIRSKIPSRMKEEGVILDSRSLSISDYKIELKKKLIEEVKEVYSSTRQDELITELADVMEVISAILKVNKIDYKEIKQVQKEKREINGYFTSENYINYIKVSRENYKVINYIENKNRHYKL